MSEKESGAEQISSRKMSESGKVVEKMVYHTIHRQVTFGKNTSSLEYCACYAL